MPDLEADYTIDWDDAPAAAQPRREPQPWDGEDEPRIPAKADRDLAVVQAAAARKASPPASGKAGDEPKDAVVSSWSRVTFMGREFRIAERVGLMPLLKFASSADVDTTDPRALSAMYALLRDCIYEGTPACGECSECEDGNEASCKYFDRGDWSAFEEHAMITKADADDLLNVVTKVLEVVSGRPQQPRSGSSAGPRRTQRASTGRSSGKAGRGSRR